MSLSRRLLLASQLALALALAVIADAQAKDPKDIVIGASAGPYADQVRLGIKPILEKQGYKVRIVEFNDDIQPIFAGAAAWPRPAPGAWPPGQPGRDRIPSARYPGSLIHH